MADALGGPRRPLRDLVVAPGGLTFESLGEFPTPVEPFDDVARPLGARAPVFIKRDDVSSPLYGGNKVRTLEVLFADAKRAGASRIHSTGAYGTNHGLAAALHARRVGLEPGVVLFPQPRTRCAVENLRATLSCKPVVLDLPHWSALPFGMAQTALRDRRDGVHSVVMVPGGATPRGGLAYVNAALELCAQVQQGLLERPSHVVVGVGSNCTTAGLLVGFELAARLGLLAGNAPIVHGVRVTPWPVTSALRVAHLAAGISAELAGLLGDPGLARTASELAKGLVVDGGQIGFGYGRPTRRGREVLAVARDVCGFTLDTTYSAKSFAGAVEVARRASGPVVFWSTKSTVPLPPADVAAIAAAPRRMRHFCRDL